ncbi:anti-sigma factor [Pseudonocardia sp. KRD-184]|uniref:Anti-sigma factor n=1 Tax=Pseudonocardia oceani TaxID=2792013 RepID=A0ABS6U417_9PSEU|nr:anti-sigma factor [Pseudonocardia oceani]MBW0090401.1 anti-sigma factor [Pseudonocardia oceani]MBW0096687.1 anti-sigma factor [Pseudonocardia oceani]MBW0121077.1 anti-sigma factor [Pseudonocardia oceani]MBW0126953.1 anti-sigma factor [Pseudonocardia oceani]
MWHPDPDLLTLAALPAEARDPDVQRHLEGCALCRGHVESLRRTVDLAVAGAADGSEYGEPPDRVWAAITGELHITPDAAAASAPAPVSRPFLRRAAVPVAAALVALVAGLGLGWAVASAPPRTGPQAVLAAVDAAEPGASGTAGLAEDRGQRVVVVRVEGAVPPPGTEYLEAWLMDTSGGGLVSLGALARDGDGYRGEFSVPADLPTARFATVDVSAERWDGDERHSRISLVRGALT